MAAFDIGQRPDTGRTIALENGARPIDRPSVDWHDRPSTEPAEKRAALQRWADHVERIVSGEPTGKVVPFGR